MNAQILIVTNNKIKITQFLIIKILNHTLINLIHKFVIKILHYINSNL